MTCVQPGVLRPHHKPNARRVETVERLREIVIFVCHYAGWPNGARLSSIVEETIAKAQRSAQKSAQKS